MKIFPNYSSLKLILIHIEICVECGILIHVVTSDRLPVIHISTSIELVQEGEWMMFRERLT